MLLRKNVGIIRENVVPPRVWYMWLLYDGWS